MTDSNRKQPASKRHSRPPPAGGERTACAEPKHRAPAAGPHAALLRDLSVRPTRQRQALAELLFGKGVRHLTADQLHAEAAAAGLNMSLATVYNTLNQFLAAGLLRQVVIDVNRAYFDTNPHPHHHFYLEESGALIDIAGDAIDLHVMPSMPEGTELARVDVLIRVKSRR